LLKQNQSDVRNRRREKRLWHDSSLPQTPLGCSTCKERKYCGSLKLKSSIFDCLSFCCGTPNNCDRVCRNHPDYALRVREVGGFDLAAIPRAKRLFVPRLPPTSAILFHGNSRSAIIAPGSIVLPLSKVVNRQDGTPRFASPNELRAAFGVHPSTQVFLSGTERDPPLERWWRLGEASRRNTIRSLKTCGVSFVTTPNFSLFINRPRWDDMHALMRIAIVHWEFLDEGMPAALHVNGRTEHDFARWGLFLRTRPEISHIAYEFTTGTGWGDRCKDHAAWLLQLAQFVDRPLHLTVRGGSKILPTLASAFSQISVWDGTAFMKSMNRQRAVRLPDGRIEWKSSPTRPGAPLDKLLNHNILVFNHSLEESLNDIREPELQLALA
jgi:hypothetical protein